LRSASARGERAHEVLEAMRSSMAQLIDVRGRVAMQCKAHAQRHLRAGHTHEREESRELLLLPDSRRIRTRHVPVHVGSGHQWHTVTVTSPCAVSRVHASDRCGRLSSVWD
jgi:hypothetical protein